MRHDWIDEAPPRLMGDPCRRCRNCKAWQQRHADYSWGRVTGYQWWPLVGRCKGPKAQPEPGGTDEDVQG